MIAVHQQFAEPCHQSILRAPTPDFHVTSVSCEPAALSRPAADGGAKACRQSASHSLAAREPGITVRRLQVAPAHEPTSSRGEADERASRLRRLTSVDRQGASPQRISHWPTRFFARWLASPHSPCRRPTLATAAALCSFLAFCPSEPIAPVRRWKTWKMPCRKEFKGRREEGQGLSEFEGRSASLSAIIVKLRAGHPSCGTESIVGAFRSACLAKG